MKLTSKYCPLTVASFTGLDVPKRIIGNWLQNPDSRAFLFCGESGTGKSRMAEAIARSLNPDNPTSPFTYIRVPSQECTVERVREIQGRLLYAPWGSFWILQVEEADLMSAGAQNAFLSLLDAIPERTVIIFTCNSVERLEPRFLSRCSQINFSNYGLNGAGSAFLRSVWAQETQAPEPDFSRILKNERNNLRASLNHIENLIMAEVCQ